MLRKLLVLTLVFVGAITLVGCKSEPEGLTDTEKVTAAHGNLEIITSTDTDLVLPLEGLHAAVITWVSANPDLIAADGTITQPSVTEGDQQVLLTATIKIGEVSFQKEFTVTVKATTILNDLEKLAVAVPALTLDSIVGSNMTLPTTGEEGVTIAWTSSNTMYIANDGTVTKPTLTVGNVVVTLTAVLTSGSESFTKTFDVTVSANTELTDLEILTNAANVILLTVSGNVEGNFELPAAATGNAIVWSSSNTDLVVINGTTAEVTRPASDAGNQEVILTATLTLGTETVTRDFPVSIKAEDPANVYASIAAMHDAAIIGEVIEFTGVVTGVFKTGYFLSDGTNALGIYNPGTTLTDIAIGDEIKVKGAYSVYNTLYQLGSVTSEARLSTGNANPLTPTVVTVAELFAVDSSDALIHGMLYEVTGTVELQGSYDNVYLVDGADKVLVYYDSTPESIAALEAVVGKDVTITVFYYTDHGTNGPMVAYDGGAAGIVVNTLPDDEALAADIAALAADVPGITLESIVLPAMGPNGTAFTGWTSSDVAVLANDGTFVALGATSTVVTFTGTATIGALTETVTVDVLVPLNSTVAEVLAMSSGDLFQVTGVIYEMAYYGFYIEQGGDFIFVYSKQYAGPAVVGDEITLLGARDEYNGLAQINLKSEITINSSLNAVPSPVNTTVEALQYDLVPRGTTAIVTGTISIEGSYSNVFITGAAGGKVEVYYRSNASELAGFVGKIVTVEFVTYHNELVLYQGVAADVTEVTAFTDLEKAQAAADMISLGDIMNVTNDLTLPATDATTSAAITWATSDAAVVDAAGVVTTTPGAETYATLTATVTVGAESVTRDFMIVVLDPDTLTPLSVSEALLLTDGPSLLVTGIVTGTYLTNGDNEVVLQDLVTGEGIYVDFDVTGAVVGDIVVVRGYLETYTSYTNNKRQLDGGSLVSIVSSGNAVMVNAETDVAVIADDFASMLVYTTTLTVKSFDTYGYVFFTGSATRDLTFSMNTYAPYFQDVYVVGDTLEVTFTVMDINYDNTRIVNVQLPALTDAQNMVAAKGALEVSATITENLVPVLAMAEYNATVTWASDNVAVIALDGTVTRPLNGSGDATVTLTATVTVGTLVEDVVFVVTVPELVPSAPLFFSEYAEAPGGSCKYAEIFNPTASDVDLTGYRIIQGNNGKMFSEEYRTTELTGTLAAGGILVVGNTACLDITDGAHDASLANPFPLTGIDFFVETAVGYTNGDDAIGLFFYSELLDVIGQEGVDPGSNWPVGDGDLLGGYTSNMIMVRVATVESGETDWAIGAMQWVVSTDNRDYSTVGVHTYTPAP